MSITQRSSTSKLISVLVAASEPLICQALALFLDQQEDIEIVATLHDGRQALRRIRSLKPRVAVLEQFLVNLNGANAAVKLLEETKGETRSVLLCRTKTIVVAQALRAGVPGCLCTNDPMDSLAQAVRLVAAGAIFVCPDFSRMARERVNQCLTEREREILQLIGEGKTTKEIAHVLGIRWKTADHHRTNLMEKLDIHNIAALTRFAIREGLIAP